MNIKRCEHTASNIHTEIFTALLNNHMDRAVGKDIKYIENMG